MRDDNENPKAPNDNSEGSGVSRRDFLKISGISAAVPLVAGPKMVMAAGQEVPVYGPGKVPMEFAINGKSYKADLEPRVTLLDALRDQFELTGAKRVCDRGECGAYWELSLYRFQNKLTPVLQPEKWFSRCWVPLVN